MQEPPASNAKMLIIGKIFSSRPYTAIIKIMRIQSVRLTKAELSVPSENANEVPATKVPTSDDHVYVKGLREMFHNRIHKLDENDSLYDLINDTPSNISKYE